MATRRHSYYKIQSGTTKSLARDVPEPGAMIYNEDDGFVYICDLFGWHKITGAAPLTLIYDFDGTNQFAATVKLPAGETMVLDWGDGTETQVDGADDVAVQVSSGYTAPGQYFVTWSGAVEQITYFDAESPDVNLDINVFAKMTNLKHLDLFGSKCYGPIESLENNAELEYLDIDFTEVTGDISKIWLLPKLHTIYAYAEVTMPDSFQTDRKPDIPGQAIRVHIGTTRDGATGNKGVAIRNAIQVFQDCTQCFIDLSKYSRVDGLRSVSDAVFKIVNNGGIVSAHMLRQDTFSARFPKQGNNYQSNVGCSSTPVSLGGDGNFWCFQVEGTVLPDPFNLTAIVLDGTYCARFAYSGQIANPAVDFYKTEYDNNVGDVFCFNTWWFPQAPNLKGFDIWVNGRKSECSMGSRWDERWWNTTIISKEAGNDTQYEFRFNGKLFPDGIESRNDLTTLYRINPAP